MHEERDGNLKTFPHCARTAPAVLQGSVRGPRPRIYLAPNTGLHSPVVNIFNPENDNINMNQVLAGIDIELGPGNPNAVGVFARGAQGVSVQVGGKHGSCVGPAENLAASMSCSSMTSLPPCWLAAKVGCAVLAT